MSGKPTSADGKVRGGKVKRQPASRRPAQKKSGNMKAVLKVAEAKFSAIGRGWDYHMSRRDENVSRYHSEVEKSAAQISPDMWARVGADHRRQLPTERDGVALLKHQQSGVGGRLDVRDVEVSHHAFINSIGPENRFPDFNDLVEGTGVATAGLSVPMASLNSATNVMAAVVKDSTCAGGPGVSIESGATVSGVSGRKKSLGVAANKMAAKPKGVDRLVKPGGSRGRGKAPNKKLIVAALDDDEVFETPCVRKSSLPSKMKYKSTEKAAPILHRALTSGKTFSQEIITSPILSTPPSDFNPFEPLDECVRQFRAGVVTPTLSITSSPIEERRRRRAMLSLKNVKDVLPLGNSQVLSSPEDGGINATSTPRASMQPLEDDGTNASNNPRASMPPSPSGCISAPSTSRALLPLFEDGGIDAPGPSHAVTPSASVTEKSPTAVVPPSSGDDNMDDLQVFSQPHEMQVIRQVVEMGREFEKKAASVKVLVEEEERQYQWFIDAADADELELRLLEEERRRILEEQDKLIEQQKLKVKANRAKITSCSISLEQKRRELDKYLKKKEAFDRLFGASK